MVKNTQNILYCPIIFEITALLLTTLGFPEVTIWETSDELGRLYGCELCQAVQVDKRYRDRLWLYRQGSDVTEYTAFLNYTQRQGLEFQLDWELFRTVKQIMETEFISEKLVHLCPLTPGSFWEDSTVLRHGWHESYGLVDSSRIMFC